jgi:hypothetical protein
MHIRQGRVLVLAARKCEEGVWNARISILNETVFYRAVMLQVLE